MTIEQPFCFHKPRLRSLMLVFITLNVFGLTCVLLSSTKRLYFADVSRDLFGIDVLPALNGIMNSSLILQLENRKNNISDFELKFTDVNNIQRQTPNTNMDTTNRELLNASEIRMGNSTADTVNTFTAKTKNQDIFGNPVLQDSEKSQRQDECINCFIHNFKYLLNNKNICKLYANQSAIDLLILIFTGHNNTLRRQTYRETWLTYSKNNTANVRYAFLFGEVTDIGLRETVQKESEIFGDIIKESFVDTYGNLTYKTIMGFKWATSYCNVTKAVMKTDDDMYVNVPNLLNIARNNIDLLQTTVVGFCLEVIPPNRDNSSKWFASFKSYPGKSYPGFCSGTGYVTSINITRQIYEISSHVPFFHLEDVYVSLCIKRLGYHLKRIKGFNSYRPKLDPCVYKGNQLLTSHEMTPDMIKKMWNSKC